MAYPGEPLYPYVHDQTGGRSVAGLSPTVVKRWVGSELQRLREAAGISQPAAAQRIGKAKAVVSHAERARNFPALPDLEILLNLYGHPSRTPFFRRLIERAKQGEDWWVDSGELADAVPEWFELLLGMEWSASKISSYDAQWVPGLFHTPEYAEVLYRAGERDLTDGEIAAKIQVRMARQAVITRPDPPHIRCVLDEAAVRRQVGGRAVWQAQLQRLLELNELANVEILVLPEVLGAHAGGEGTFTIIDFPPDFAEETEDGPAIPAVAYIENRTQGIYYEETDSVADFRRVFDRLYEQVKEEEVNYALASVVKKALRE